MNRCMNLILSVTFIVALCSGCMDYKSITTIDSVKESFLPSYIGTNSDEISNVSALIKQLPGGETFKKINVQGEYVRITYGYSQGAIPDGQIDNYWFGKPSTLSETFLYNAIYEAILIPNAKAYEVIVDNRRFEVSKEEMQAWLQQHFPDFPENLYNGKEVNHFLMKHQQDIQQLVQTPSVRKAFFSRHPITKF
ncbi:hypothetical protein [Priestia koreensis]|uniref:DUF4825 domain-containing protein n=1 Tax=Priestia koreensis TaxID=284581 RepID=A0A0M0L5J9_9BACI|nr:hypothetical protein [Priestia koreensis]KOO46137.1 hypothetical protein AMD01_09720 [Priestia koreensis]